jgi:hypothetical protein
MLSCLRVNLAAQRCFKTVVVPRQSRMKPLDCSLSTEREPLLGAAIVSLIVLTIVGAIGGLVLSRVLARAPARNEDAPGDGENEGGGQEDNLSEENKRSFRFFLGRVQPSPRCS